MERLRTEPTESAESTTHFESGRPRVLVGERASRPMLAIAGGKGGVGKTTTTLALADALPGRPLVVDADRGMPNLHEMAGVGPCPSLDAVVGTDQDGAKSDPPLAPALDCRVVAAPDPDAARTNVLLTRLRHTEVAADSPSILVDCPAGASIDAATPLQVADAVVLVSTACAPALRDTAKTASMARAVGTPVAGLVLTRTHLRPPGLDTLFDCPLLGTVPRSSAGAVAGDTLSDRRVRERYQAVAERLLDQVSAGERTEQSARVDFADNIFIG
jgi:septum site-determining protein MinD